MTLSTPIKIVALAGLVCIVVLGGALALMAARQHAASAPLALPLPAVHRTTTPAAPARPRVVLEPGLPAPVHRTLRRSREAVVVLTAPGLEADRTLVAAARNGARAAHVPLVVLDVSRDAIAASLATWLPGVGDPAVVVVRRPGTPVETLRGWADATMVAQVAADAR